MPVVTEETVAKLAELSAADLVALKELLGVTPQPAATGKQRFDPEANLPPDKPLAVPVRFWNARYPEEKIRIAGRAKATQFWNGSFNAKTERELAACRAMGSHVYEGDDLDRARVCPVCEHPSTNERYAAAHVRFAHANAR